MPSRPNRPDESDEDLDGPKATGAPLPPRIAAAIGLAAVTVSIVSSLILVVRHRVLSGPGDQLTYYEQASRLIPFTHHYYGPGYFVALRLVHDLTGLDWFPAGRVLSWLSLIVVLALTSHLAVRLLGRESGMLALALVAINPTIIGQGYSSLTMMYGAAWSLAAIASTLRADSGRAWTWFGSGLFFGLAGLTRFQNNALLLGAILGIMIQAGNPWPGRLARAGWLLAGGLVPGLAWKALLLRLQGSVPENFNFVHLTIALGDFRTFFDVETAIRKYGSTWGVLTSHWTAPLRIAALATKEALKFPFGVGFGLIFLAAGWLLPGLVAAAQRRSWHGPWLMAFLLGLFLTGLASQGWLFYYTTFVPFAAILVGLAIQTTRDAAPPPFHRGRVAWLIVLGSTAVWSPAMVWAEFRDQNWSELVPARTFLADRGRIEPVIACSTAGSVAYRTGVDFVDQSAIMRPGETAKLVDRLRRHGVTHLVITERHTPQEFPDLESLLDDQVSDLPPGLRRELLVERPKRLAIYRVLPE